MGARAFPIVDSGDVARAARFYVELLGFVEVFRHPAEGELDYVGLALGESRLGVATTRAPEGLLGLRVGAQPRFELFVHVEDVDAAVERLRGAGAPVLREPEDMPWGERLAYAADPDGNPVGLAARIEPG